MKSNKAFWGAYALFVGLALSLGSLAIFLHFYHLPGAQVSFFLAFIIMAFSVITVWIRLWKVLFKKKRK